MPVSGASILAKAVTDLDKAETLAQVPKFTEDKLHKLKQQVRSVKSKDQEKKFAEEKDIPIILPDIPEADKHLYINLDARSRWKAIQAVFRETKEKTDKLENLCQEATEMRKRVRRRRNSRVKDPEFAGRTLAEWIKIKREQDLGSSVTSSTAVGSDTASVSTHSNHVTSSKLVGTLICHNTMCRNPINFLYNPGHVTL